MVLGCKKACFEGFFVGLSGQPGPILPVSHGRQISTRQTPWIQPVRHTGPFWRSLSRPALVKNDRLAFCCVKVGQGPRGHIFFGCSYFWMRSRTFKTTPPIITDPPVTSHSIHDAKGSSILIFPPYSIGFNRGAIADLNRHSHIEIPLQPSHMNSKSNGPPILIRISDKNSFIY